MPWEIWDICYNMLRDRTVGKNKYLRTFLSKISSNTDLN